MKWREVTLGELIDLKHGFAFKSRYFADEGRYILLTPGNCQESGGLKLKGGKEKYYTGDVPDGYLLHEGDLIVVMTDLVNSAPILGGSFLIPEDDKYLHNQRLGLVEILDSKRIDKRFAYYLLNTYPYRSQVRGSASGATVRHTSPTRIRACRVKVPLDVTYQKQIAEVLTAYDDLIENNRRRMALLEEAARQLYREWFVRLRFPGHEHTRIIDGVPEGWNRAHVSELVKRVPAGKLYSQRNALAEGTVPILDQGRTGVIGYHNTEPSVKASLEAPIIVFANHTCYQRVIHYPFSAIQNVLPFVPTTENARNIYWLHHATDGLVKLNAYKGHWPEFMAKTANLPPARLCQSFGEIARNCHLMIHTLEQKNKKLANARDLLLPRLMNGEIAV